MRSHVLVHPRERNWVSGRDTDVAVDCACCLGVVVVDVDANLSEHDYSKVTVGFVVDEMLFVVGIYLFNKSILISQFQIIYIES